MVANLRFAHGISTSFLPRFGLFKVVVSSLLNLSVNERGEPRLPQLPPGYVPGSYILIINKVNVWTDRKLTDFGVETFSS